MPPPTGTTYWYHPDHLGSTSVVTDPDGEAYERIEYTPFGEMWLEHQHDANTRGEGYIPYRFTSKEWDEETGLYYYGARYLEPKLSRWMSADPAGFGLVNPMDGEGKPREGYSVVEGLNWYSYVSNNPVKYIDPSGLMTFQIGIGGTLGAGAGVTGEVGIIVSYSKEKGFDIGLYIKGGIGAFVGGAATVDLSGTVAPLADEISDMEGETSTTGGSKNLTIFSFPVSAGAEASIPLDKGSGKNTSATASASIGFGTPGEGHTIYTDTKVISGKETLSKAWDVTRGIGEKIIDGVNQIGGEIINNTKGFITDLWADPDAGGE